MELKSNDTPGQPGPRTMREMGRRGGSATKAKADPDYYKRIGRLGGVARKRSVDPGLLREFALRGGEARKNGVRRKDRAPEPDNTMPVEEARRRAGEAARRMDRSRLKKHDREFYRKLGRKGLDAAVKKLGRDGLRELGRRTGQKLLEERGRDYFVGLVAHRVAATALLPGLARARHDAELTQRELAQFAGIGLSTVARLETAGGRARRRTIERLAEVVGTTPEALLADPVRPTRGGSAGSET